MPTACESRFVIGPNASLSVRGAWWVLGLVGGVTLGFGVMAAMVGFWPILPFAGLEVAALGGALWVSLRRNRYREVVSLTADLVVVEFGLVGQGAQARVELPRAWIRVRLEPGRRAHEPTRLVLSCSGRRVEIGRCLTDDEREELVKRLESCLRQTVQAPVRESTEANLGER